MFNTTTTLLQKKAREKHQEESLSGKTKKSVKITMSFPLRKKEESLSEKIKKSVKITMSFRWSFFVLDTVLKVW